MQTGYTGASADDSAHEPPQPTLPDNVHPPQESQKVPSVQVAPEKNDPVVVTVVRDMSENRPDRALDALRQCPASNQKLLMVLCAMVAELGGGKVDATDPTFAEHINTMIESAHLEVRPFLPLCIDKMFFCRDIRSFGNYEPLPAHYEFRSGGERCGEMVRVYLELRNFPVRQQQEFFESTLSSKLEIRDSQDRVVFRHDEPARVFRSRSSRNDMFLQYEFEVPPRLPPGTYSLWIEIEDAQSRPTRIVHKAIEMHIGSGNTFAGSAP